jgi:hypothetical protein
VYEIDFSIENYKRENKKKKDAIFSIDKLHKKKIKQMIKSLESNSYQDLFLQ